MASRTSLDEMDYIRRRELQERAAAKQASTLAARRIHQELARLYAELANCPACMTERGSKSAIAEIGV